MAAAEHPARRSSLTSKLLHFGLGRKRPGSTSHLMQARSPVGTEEKKPQLFNQLDAAAQAAENVPHRIGSSSQLEEIRRTVEDSEARRHALDKAHNAGLHNAGRGVGIDIPRLTSKDEDADSYRSTLAVINNILGGYDDKNCSPLALQEFARQAYHLSPQEHSSLAASLSRHEQQHYKPCLRLTLESASDLVGKDVGGTSDPYAVLRLFTVDEASKGRHHVKDKHAQEHQRQVSKVQEKNINPVWNETFEFELDKPELSLISIDLWDHDESISVGSALNSVTKIRNLGHVTRGIKEGVQRLTRDLRDGEDDFLGFVEFPVNAMPAKGSRQVLRLQPRSEKSHVRGTVSLRVEWFTKPVNRSDKEPTPWPLVQKYCSLVYHIMRYEGREYDGDRKRAWPGTLSAQADMLLQQHALQIALTPLQQAVTHFRCYMAAHIEEGVNLDTLYTSLERVNAQLPNTIGASGLSKEEEAAFVGAVDQGIASALELFGEVLDEVQLTRDGALVLSVYVKFYKLCFSIGPWRNHGYNENRRAEGEARRALRKHLEVKLAKVFEEQRPDKTYTGRDVVQVVRTLRWAVETLSNSYNAILGAFKPIGIDIFSLMLDVWTPQIQAHVKRTVDAWSPPTVIQGEDLGSFGLIFELYFVIRKYTELIQHAEAETRAVLTELNMAAIFSPVVMHWIMLSKASGPGWVQQAIALDKVVPVTGTVGHSTSVLDVFRILNDLYEFWLKLDWPKTDELYPHLLTMLVESICSCGQAFLHGTFTELQRRKFFDDDGRFDVSDKLCIMFNNMQEVSFKLQEIFDTVGIEAMNQAHLAKVRAEQGDEAADNPVNQLTVKKVAMEALTTAAADLRHAADVATDAMHHDITHYIGQAVFNSRLSSQDPNVEVTMADLQEVMGDLLDYLESNLLTLSEQLYEETFEIYLQELWFSVLTCVRLVLAPPEARRSKLDALGRHQTSLMKLLLTSLRNFFLQDGNGLSSKVLDGPEYCETLKLLNLAVADNFEQMEYEFYKCLTEQQRTTSVTVRGELEIDLTVHSTPKASVVELHAYRGKNFPPMDSNGKADPYIIMEIHPRRNVHPAKSAVFKKNLEPEFNCTLKLEVPDTVESSVLRIAVNDHNMLSSDRLIGEVFVDLRQWLQDHGQQTTPKRLRLHIDRPIGPTQTIFRLIERQANLHKEAAHFVKERKAVASHST